MEDNIYARGKIYKIVDNVTNKCYYGSTTLKTVEARLGRHETSYRRYLEGKEHYLSSFEVLQNDDYYVELVEDYPCDNKDELHKRETYYIINNECVNKYRAYVSQDERRAAQRERGKRYNETHREEKIEYDKNYQRAHPELKKLADKKYYDNNKEQILAKAKLKRQKDKVPSTLKCDESIDCPCGGYSTKKDWKRHTRTMMHQEYEHDKKFGIIRN